MCSGAQCVRAGGSSSGMGATCAEAPDAAIRGNTENSTAGRRWRIAPKIPRPPRRYRIGSTTTAVPYASTSVTPFMISVAS